jgi:hypothetical protein
MITMDQCIPQIQRDNTPKIREVCFEAPVMINIHRMSGLSPPQVLRLHLLQIDMVEAIHL